MTVIMHAAIAVARDSLRAHESRTAQALLRFAEPFRPALNRLAARHPRLADLAISFPALLFGLAVPRREFDPEPVIHRVIMGASLAELSGAAGIPLWTRKLHPRAFAAALPALPDTPAFRAQIANHLPADRKAAAEWLQTIAFASFWGHPELAIWCAQNFGAKRAQWFRTFLPRLCVWAWYSQQSDTWGASTIQQRWSPDISFTRAADAIFSWADDLEDHVFMPNPGLGDPWAAPATVDGYAFDPVLTVADLHAAAKGLDNCARTYTDSIRRNRYRIWVVRKDNDTVAMLSLANDVVMRIGQLYGPRNQPVTPELALAAHRWFQGYCAPRKIERFPDVLSLQAWQRLWTPYWLAKRRLPAWLPLRPGNYSGDWMMRPDQRVWLRRRLRRRRRRAA